MVAMEFSAEHRFAFPPGPVMEAMVDPQLYVDLELPDVSRPEVLERNEEAGRSCLKLRYTFLGRLDPIAKGLLGAAQLRWLQEVCVESLGATGSLSVVAEDQPRRLHGEAQITFLPDGAGTRRTIAGTLVVAVPIVAALAERSIVSGLLGRLDLEADALRARLGAT